MCASNQTNFYIITPENESNKDFRRFIRFLNALIQLHGEMWDKKLEKRFSINESKMYSGLPNFYYGLKEGVTFYTDMRPKGLERKTVKQWKKENGI